MEDLRIRSIQYIADKEPTYNRLINQHIESCKISMQIINEKLDIIAILQTMLEERDEKIRRLEEEKFLLKREKFIKETNLEIEIKDLKEVLTEQYKLIDDLRQKIKK